MPAPAGVVDLAGARILAVLPEHLDEVAGVNIVTNLFSIVAENRICLSGDRALSQIRQKAVHHGSGVPWTSQTSAAKANGVASKVTAIFLHHRISSQFGDAEQRMGSVVDRHLLIDSVLKIAMG